MPISAMRGQRDQPDALVHHWRHRTPSTPRHCPMQIVSCHPMPRCSSALFTHRSRGGATESRTINSYGDSVALDTFSPSICLNSIGTARLPKRGISRHSAVMDGVVTVHMNESSHDTMEMSSGTLNPCSKATRMPSMAITSLSYTIAVGESGNESRREVHSQPCSGV